MRAAYGLEEKDDSYAARQELYEHLSEGKTVWSPARLAAHRLKAGGTWRELAEKKRRKRAASGPKGAGGGKQKMAKGGEASGA